MRKFKIIITAPEKLGLAMVSPLGGILGMYLAIIFRIRSLSTYSPNIGATYFR